MAWEIILNTAFSSHKYHHILLLKRLNCNEVNLLLQPSKNTMVVAHWKWTKAIQWYSTIYCLMTFRQSLNNLPLAPLMVLMGLQTIHSLLDRRTHVFSLIDVGILVTLNAILITWIQLAWCCLGKNLTSAWSQARNKLSVSKPKKLKQKILLTAEAYFNRPRLSASHVDAACV